MTEITARLSTALADRYRLEHHLGEGGMATVYLAEDLKHDRKVALKVLKPELAAVLGADRFVQEIKTTASLQHPNILPLFDSGAAGDQDGGTAFLFYVMPYIEGETLREKLDRETQLGIDEAVKITIEIAEALEAAHQKGVIHRDIKPDNILLHNGRPMVADFGIALAVSAAAGGRMTETGLSLGTPHYMSPEQATAEKDISARSDVYSLGTVLYEMLTGEPPHMGNSAQQIIMKIVTDTARPVTELRKSVPPHVAAAVAHALEKLPADRFASAARFAEALTNPSLVLPTTSAAGATIDRSARSWKRLALASSAAAVVFAVLWGWALLRPGETPSGVLRVAVPFADDQRVEPLGFAPLAAISPDGSKLVYLGPPTEGAFSQLWTRPLDRLDGTPIVGTENGYHFAFSPAGDAITYGTGAGGIVSLRVVSLSGAPPVTLLDSVYWTGRDWGDDDNVYYTNPVFGISRVAAVGGVPEVVTSLDTAQGEALHHSPHVLPNARGMLYTVAIGTQSATRTYEIALADLETGESRRLFQGVNARYASSGHILVVRADGALLAAPFDLRALELRGAPVPVMEGVPVKAFGAVDLSLADNGTLVYASGGGFLQEFELVWVDRDGNARPVVQDWVSAFTTWDLSPDGRSLAFSRQTPSDEHVWIKQISGPEAKLTFEGDQNYRPAWNARGDMVAFVSRSPTGSYALFQRRADGAAEPELLVEDDRGVEQAQFSRDGRWLVYRVGGESGQRDILATRPGVDSIPLPAVTSPHNEYMPALSPDGRYLAYVSDESGRPEIHVRPFPNTSETRWLVSEDGGTMPRWGGTGRELFYVHEQVLVAARVSLDPTFSVVERRELFSAADFAVAGAFHWRYDVADGGQRFLFRRAIGAESSSVILVANWLEELKAKVEN